MTGIEKTLVVIGCVGMVMIVIGIAGAIHDQNSPAYQLNQKAKELAKIEPCGG